MSLIQGIAFFSANLLAAPVFGRLVDVFDRRNILVVAICLRSLFTALCGRADTYSDCSSLASASVRVKHVSGYAAPVSRTDRCVESYFNLSVVRFVTRGERTSAADRIASISRRGTIDSPRLSSRI
ncbi:MFS family permease [Paraburkholderia sp. WC7.3g]|uniref:hypothetical protein n=1 Tax=Paraburkholderia TaxID=1822464 RepID=UPI001FECA796|nr:hypothetical protein [Paraburkholderia podalyriae]